MWRSGDPYPEKKIFLMIKLLWTVFNILERKNARLSAPRKMVQLQMLIKKGIKCGASTNILL